MHGIGQILPGLAATPNIHPMLVHFPIALFPFSLLLWLLALRPYPRLGGSARLTFLIATGSMIPAVAAGLWAQRFMVHGAGSLISVHRTFMLTALGLSLLVSAMVARRRRIDSPRGRAVFTAGVLLVNTVVLLGADRGALIAVDLRKGIDLQLSSAGLPEGGARTGALISDGRHAAMPGDSTRGRLLYERLRCDGCHGDSRPIEGPGLPPTLAYAGSKLRPEWMVAYLQHPHRMRWLDADRRPRTRMPDFQLDANEAEDLTAWLTGRTDETRFSARPLEELPLRAEEAKAGRDLVAQYACRGCHVIGGSGNHLGPALDGVGARLRPAYVFAFLENPRAIVPGTAMPNFHLWDDEARAITAYLMTQDAPPAGTPDERVK